MVENSERRGPTKSTVRGEHGDRQKVGIDIKRDLHRRMKSEAALRDMDAGEAYDSAAALWLAIDEGLAVQVHKGGKQLPKVVVDLLREYVRGGGNTTVVTPDNPKNYGKKINVGHVAAVSKSDIISDTAPREVPSRISALLHAIYDSGSDVSIDAVEVVLEALARRVPENIAIGGESVFNDSSDAVKTDDGRRVEEIAAGIRSAESALDEIESDAREISREAESFKAEPHKPGGDIPRKKRSG